MGKAQEFKHKAKQDVKNIAEYLHTLADGVENGAVTLENEAQQIVLKPEGMVDMELKSKVDGEKCKLEIEFKWTQSKESHLSIS